MKQLCYFLFGIVALRLIEYILIVYAEQEYHCAAFLPEYSEAYLWN